MPKFPDLLSGEPLRFSRRALVMAGVAATALTVWAGATTWYILFKDEIGQRYLAHQAELRFAYEDEVAGLRQRLEREITQSMVERNGFKARVDALAARQQEIDGRQGRILQLAGRLGLGPAAAPAASPPPPVARPAASPVSAAQPVAPRSDAKPTPLGDTLILRRDPDDDRATSAAEPERPARDRLSALDTDLSRVAAENEAIVRDLRVTVDGQAGRLRAALARTGLGRTIDARSTALGGPFVPASLSHFDPLAQAAEFSVGEWERLRGTVRSLPLGQPLAGDLEQTSPFGYRTDPFTRGLALHTGEDFRAEYGAPVRATAAGRVTVTEYTGGYGNMVEIDHGGGLTTRYGHLSAYLVAPGTNVEAGQPIGRAGSTGRSTGTHVHYETRIDGEPVNPERFLEAGRAVAEALKL